MGYNPVGITIIHYSFCILACDHITRYNLLAQSYTTLVECSTEDVLDRVFVCRVYSDRKG